MEQATKLVLIADDFDDAANVLGEYVEHATPCRVKTAKDGLAAVELAREEIPVAAVLDVDMPRMNGIEAARVLRSLAKGRPPLLIALTGAHEEEARRAGVFDYVFTKPADYEMLVDLLETAL